MSRHLVNLYEVPTLFYAGTAIAFAAGIAATLLVALGWAYVGLRVVHSSIHLTIERRAVAFPRLLRELARAARLLGRARRGT